MFWKMHKWLFNLICRTGQRIVDAAMRSADTRRPVRLEEFA
jgi:hypothetical protein